MTPHYAHRAAERTEENEAVLQPELHGAATPAPLPPEPEPPPTVIPLPDVAPKPPEPQPDLPQQAPHTANAGQWRGLFFLPTESTDDFDAFYERLDEHYMPFNDEERVAVAKFAEARWALNRRKRVVEKIEEAIYAAAPNPANWSENDFKRLALADAYRQQAEKVVRRAQRDVELFVNTRFEESRWQTNRDLAERRLQLQKHRFGFALQKAGIGIKEAAA